MALVSHMYVQHEGFLSKKDDHVLPSVDRPNPLNITSGPCRCISDGQWFFFFLLVVCLISGGRSTTREVGRRKGHTSLASQQITRGGRSGESNTMAMEQY